MGEVIPFPVKQRIRCKKIFESEIVDLSEYRKKHRIQIQMAAPMPFVPMMAFGTMMFLSALWMGFWTRM